MITIFSPKPRKIKSTIILTNFFQFLGLCKLHRINCPQIIARREFLITICKKRPSQRVWQRCRWQSWWCYSRPGRCQPQREQVLGIFIVIFERKTHSEKVIVLHRLHWKKPNEIQEKTEQRDVNPIFFASITTVYNSYNSNIFYIFFRWC